MTHPGPVRRQRGILVRIFFASTGLLCVGIGFVGLITPGLPGVVFFLIALWMFRNSSVRLETWLLNNRWIGPTLRDWDENKSMKKSTKVIAITAIWVAICYSCYKIFSQMDETFNLVGQEWYVPKAIPIFLLAMTAGLVTRYLLSVKTKVEVVNSK